MASSCAGPPPRFSFQNLLLAISNFFPVFLLPLAAAARRRLGWLFFFPAQSGVSHTPCGFVRPVKANRCGETSRPSDASSDPSSQLVLSLSFSGRPKHGPSSGFFFLPARASSDWTILEHHARCHLRL